MCLDEADSIICSHQYLRSVVKKITNKSCVCINNGADFDKFEQSQIRILEKPTEFPVNNKIPILGYYGSISTWLDYNLLINIANMNKYHIVMIGYLPGSKYLVDKYQHKNITWIPHQQFDQLAYYLSWFDACIIPFKLRNMIKGCDPIKFYEYCASGKPILTTIKVIESKNVHIISSTNVKQHMNNVNTHAISITNKIISKTNDWKSKAILFDDVIEKTKKIEIID
jgi:hypothetical protein